MEEIHANGQHDNIESPITAAEASMEKRDKKQQTKKKWNKNISKSIHLMFANKQERTLHT